MNDISNEIKAVIKTLLSKVLILFHYRSAKLNNRLIGRVNYRKHGRCYLHVLILLTFYVLLFIEIHNFRLLHEIMYLNKIPHYYHLRIEQLFDNV